MKIVMLPKNSSSYLQPCDQLMFAVMKKKYRCWRNETLILENKEPTVLECLQKMSHIYKNMPNRVVNKSFEMIKIEKFKNLQIEDADITVDEIKEELNLKMSALKLYQMPDNEIDKDEEIPNKKCKKQKNITEFFAKK
jgi:hypothetical protein